METQQQAVSAAAEVEAVSEAAEVLVGSGSLAQAAGSHEMGQAASPLSEYLRMAANLADVVLRLALDALKEVEKQALEVDLGERLNL